MPRINYRIKCCQQAYYEEMMNVVSQHWNAGLTFPESHWKVYRYLLGSVPRNIEFIFMQQS